MPELCELPETVLVYHLEYTPSQGGTEKFFSIALKLFQYPPGPPLLLGRVGGIAQGHVQPGGGF